jgi:hypothetical protein
MFSLVRGASMRRLGACSWYHGCHRARVQSFRRKSPSYYVVVRCRSPGFRRGGQLFHTRLLTGNSVLVATRTAGVVT